MVCDGKAYQYCKWIVDKKNRKVPEYVKKQASLWIDIVEERSEDAYICEKTYKIICNLLRVLMHPDLGCNMYDGLEDYAWFLITAVFCTKLKDENERNIRYYETALLVICRKNFKTFNSAVIFILLMLTEPVYSRFFSVAPDLTLSSELKLAIRKIIKSSPLLYDEFEPAFRIMSKQILCIITESEYTPLAYSQDRMDGKLANAFLADEAGALDEYPVEAMRSSQITLLNKLGIIISTEYPNDDNVLIDEMELAKLVLNDLHDDKRYFALLYIPDEEYVINDGWMKNEEVIVQSNPVSIENEVVFQAIVKKRNLAIQFENKRENYLCKHNNIKYKGLGSEGYIDIEKVKRCKIERDRIFWRGKRVWIGIDLAESDDNVSVAMLTEYKGRIRAKVWGFIPEDRIEWKRKKEHVDYKKLIREGDCFSCGDEVIDYGFVEKFIMNIEEDYEVEIVQIGYDKWNAISSVQKLEEAGYECVDVKQHSSVTHLPTKFLREMILKKLFEYEENRMLEINFQNARCVEDNNKNKYVNKKKSSGKVDMVVSIIIAMYILQQEMLFGIGDFIAQS